MDPAKNIRAGDEGVETRGGIVAITVNTSLLHHARTFP